MRLYSHGTRNPIPYQEFRETSQLAGGASGGEWRIDADREGEPISEHHPLRRMNARLRKRDGRLRGQPVPRRVRADPWPPELHSSRGDAETRRCAEDAEGPRHIPREGGHVVGGGPIRPAREGRDASREARTATSSRATCSR